MYDNYLNNVALLYKSITVNHKLLFYLKINYITGKKRVVSFLDLLIGMSKQSPEVMSDSDIREEVDTFLFEGHDTSSTAMTLTLILLGLHQDVQVYIYKKFINILYILRDNNIIIQIQ